jgi:uncharacterized paraquat-inducible protein A
MSMVSFICGGITVMLSYAFYCMGMESEEIEETDEELMVNEYSRRLHQMSCQTCRKIKNHREVEQRVFECTRCHRRTNLNAV